MSGNGVEEQEGIFSSPVPANWLSEKPPTTAVVSEFLNSRQGKRIISKALWYAIEELRKDKTRFHVDMNTMHWLLSSDVYVGYRWETQEQDTLSKKERNKTKK
jgi:hypothetical protein